MGKSVLSGPLVVDTRELGRRPGAERTSTFTVEAPADLGYDIFGVPEGSAIDLELRLEAVMEGILATGSASVHATGECVRCLAPVDEQFVVDFQELFVYDDIRDAEGAEEDDEVSMLQGDLLDLEPLLRDAVVLALPFQPLCQDDCPGLCPECGARLADDPDHGHEAAVDPRWAGLADLRTDLNQDPDEKNE